ncbi:MAG: universal stress protein, partial [Thermoleophilia bacterium]|nr:universal stress protein [Thermoleophilia bacterium]
RGWETAEEAKAYVEPLEVEAAYSVLPGKPAKATAASLEEEPADLVIVGMRGHSSLRYLFLGRTAELVMRSIDLPVLMVP